MATAKKTAKAAAPTAAKKQAPAPEPDDSDVEDGYDPDNDFSGDDDRPRSANRGSRPVRPPQAGNAGSSRSGGFHRPTGSLFEGARDSFILFQGTFDTQELHELIEAADADSIEPGKIRIKILTVDEEYQNGGPLRVNLVFAGKQQSRPQGQRGGQGNGRRPEAGRGNNRRW